MPRTPPSASELLAVLGAFFVLGAGLTLYIWHTLSDFLAGQPVDGGRYLLALATSGVFVGVTWLLARYIMSRFVEDEALED
jgi:hypothetical protein